LSPGEHDLHSDGILSKRKLLFLIVNRRRADMMPDPKVTRLKYETLVPALEATFAFFS
jgi:hypothetical protein